jgi:hypothetical protein
MADILDAHGRPVSMLGYHAAQDKGRRQAPQAAIKNEDAQLTSFGKAKLDMTAQDLPRNFELAAWALRLHVAYVSRLMPHVATGSPAVDAVLSRLIARDSKRKAFDVAERHDRDRAMSLFEIANVFYGDAAFIKLDSGKVQGIPGARIARPGFSADTDADSKEKWGRVKDNGLIVDPATGRMMEAAICSWGKNGVGLVFDHYEPAENLIFNGYFTDFDQTRGRSPLAAAINRCTDMMESLEYTALKIKLHSLLGLAFGSDASSSIIPPSLDGDESTTGERPPYKVELSRGLMVFNLRPGDTVNAIESKVPSSEFVDFTGLSIRLALLAFDIPMTFLDSSKSSFSARIADSNQYEFMCVEKRAKNASVSGEWADWKMETQWADDPDLSAALKTAGLSAEQAASGIGWVGTETPWVDKLAQLKGDQLAIGMCMDSIPRACRRRGVDWKANVDENAEVLKHATKQGWPLMVAQPGQAAAQDAKDDGNNDDAGSAAGPVQR